MKTKPRTIKQIESEIRALKRIKPKVMERGPLGENYHAAIEAQIKTLAGRLDDEDAHYTFLMHSTYVYRSARDAAKWMAGEGCLKSIAGPWKSPKVQLES